MLVLIVMTLLVAGFMLGRGSSLAAEPASHPAPTTRWSCEPGETMWAVAVRIAPHSDPRLVVADIESLNHLDGARCRAGEQLRVPTVG